MDKMQESVRFILKKEDKDLLNTIAAQDGDANKSATLRRLIRVEASRRGLNGTPPAMPVLRTALAPRNADAVQEAEAVEG